MLVKGRRSVKIVRSKVTCHKSLARFRGQRPVIRDQRTKVKSVMSVESVM